MEERLFARKATGLVREIGFGTAVLIAVCNVVGLGWQKRVFQSTGWAPVGESQYFLGIHPVVMAFLLTGIVILLSVYAFAVLSAAMPKSGGGYIFISRILNPALGFIATWLQFFSVAVSYGMIAVATMEAVLLFGGLAGIKVPGPLASSWGLFFWGVLVMVIFSGIAALGVKQTGRLLQVIFWIPAAILVVVYLLFLTATKESMEAGVLALFGHTAAEYTQAAIDQGMAEVAAGNTYWKAVASAVLAAYWAYIGYAAASFVAGEVKEAGKTLPRAMFTAGVCIMLLYMTISFLMARAGGMAGKVGDFSLTSAIGFLNYGGGSFEEAGLPKIGGWMPVIAGIQAAGIGWKWVMPLLVFFAALWVANDIPPFILTTSRMIFAMAFDRLLPPKLAEVNEKWHSPVNAIIFTTVVSLLGALAEAEVFAPLKGTAMGWLYSIVSSGGAIAATDIWDAIFFTCCAVAAFFFPIRRPDIFERSPFQHGKTTMMVIGGLATLANLWVLWIVITDPHGWGWNFLQPSTYLSPTFLFTFFLVLVGAFLYWYYSNQARRTGVALTTIFTQLPPD